MFIAYTDASIRNNKAYLAFVIVFEEKSKIKRRIVVNESDSNIAEALAISELLSFLSYYNIRGGLLLFDSNGVKRQLRRKRKLQKHIPKNTYNTLRNLNVRTQLIPRKYNLAHRICYDDKFFQSQPISSINRKYFQKVENYPDYFLQLSVLEEYRHLYNKRFATFHEAQIQLNKKIWLADPMEDLDGNKVYEIHNRRIKVIGDTIVKVSEVNYFRISNHWNVIRRVKKLKKMLE